MGPLCKWSNILKGGLRTFYVSLTSLCLCNRHWGGATWASLLSLPPILGPGVPSYQGEGFISSFHKLGVIRLALILLYSTEEDMVVGIGCLNIGL